MIRLFYERNKMGVAVPGHDHDLLARIARRIRVRNDLQQAACFHGNDNVLERHAALGK